jgi:AraC family transcriptional regulator
MPLQTFEVGSGRPFAIPVGPDLSLEEVDCRQLCQEKNWRCLTEVENDRMRDVNILVARWIDSRTVLRQEKLEHSPFRYVIGVALKATSIKLTRGSSTVLDGPMRAGTLHITGPGDPLIAEFRDPCDFVHFHVSSDYLRDCRQAAGLDRSIRVLNDLVFRDQLTELLGRRLIATASATGGVYPACVGQTLVMHVAGLEGARQTVNALPKWRFNRVREYVDAHLGEFISLADLAMAAGLSRMHFAAQFRAATGCRPRDYVLQQRIERAKEILSSDAMPLAEVAIAVGFQEQSYFSTVFKHLTDETPARWRQANKRAVSLGNNRRHR